MSIPHPLTKGLSRRSVSSDGGLQKLKPHIRLHCIRYAYSPQDLFYYTEIFQTRNPYIILPRIAHTRTTVYCSVAIDEAARILKDM